jgi:transposase
MVGVHPDGSTLTPEGIAMQSILNLGADVDSRYVMVACAAGSFKPHRIANERKAIRAWLRTVARGSRLAMESTGSYHELLADLAHRAGLQVFIVNARDLRRYGQSIGRRGKTDRIDAEVIARYIAREHGELHTYVPPTDEQRLLARLIGRRAKLVQAKDSIRQSLGGVPALQSEARRLIGHIDRVIASLDLLMQRTVQQMPAVREAAGHIATIPGFGVLTSACLGHRFTRVPYSTSDAVVAAAGLDPRPDDSGLKEGRRRLSKRGPAEDRRLLFNCARSAAQRNPWRPYYEAQLTKGLSKTAATIVLARKMLRVAFAVYTHRQPFNPLLIGGGT